MRFFYEGITVDNKAIKEAKPTPIFDALYCANMVRLRNLELENRNTNITQELSHIFKAFSDFRLVAQIREEIERVNQIGPLAPSIA